MQASDSAGDARASLFAHLQAKSPEIEAGVLNRINAIGGASEVDDPDYVHGLRAAVPAAIELGLLIIRTGDHTPPIPTPLLTQARLAARHSVSLDTVMRRYFAGHDELSAFLVEGIEETGSQVAWLASLLGALGAGFDRLLAQVSEEYALEALRRPNSTHGRLAERIKSLLAGERLDTSDLDYDFRAHHLGLVTEGDEAASAIRSLAKTLNGRHLIVHPAADTVWAWIGFREPIDRGAIDRETLSAYFAAGRNGRATAGALGVSRQTVSHRLKSIEEKIGRPLFECATNLELALNMANRGLI